MSCDDRFFYSAHFLELARDYRDLATQYRGTDLALVDDPSPIGQGLDNATGQLIINAHLAGYLPLPKLAGYVRRIRKNAKFVPRSFLFRWLSGKPMAGMSISVTPIPAERLAEIAKVEALNPQFLCSTGGILPQLAPLAFLGTTKHEPMPKNWADLRRRDAILCQWAAASIEAAPPGGSRDPWVYAQSMAGATWDEVRKAILDHPHWKQVQTANAVKLIAERYAEKHGLPTIKRRPRGRPANG